MNELKEGDDVKPDRENFSEFACEILREENSLNCERKQRIEHPFEILN